MASSVFYLFLTASKRHPIFKLKDGTSEPPPLFINEKKNNGGRQPSIRPLVICQNTGEHREARASILE